MKFKNALGGFTFAAALTATTVANAVSIDATDRGWYARDIDGIVHHTEGNLNYLVGGIFAIGGRMPTLAAGGGAQTIFGFSNNPDLSLTQLLVTVPEPSSIAIFGLGLITLVYGRRRVSR